MRTSIVFVVECGDCSATSTPHPSEREAIAAARKAGWVELARGVPICRGCAPAYRQALATVRAEEAAARLTPPEVPA